MIKGIFEKHTPNIILNGERLIAFFPRSVTRPGCTSSPLLFNTIPGQLEKKKKAKDSKLKRMNTVF